jgi:hypothetical protein
MAGVRREAETGYPGITTRLKEIVDVVLLSIPFFATWGSTLFVSLRDHRRPNIKYFNRLLNMMLVCQRYHGPGVGTYTPNFFVELNHELLLSQPIGIIFVIRGIASIWRLN